MVAGSRADEFAALLGEDFRDALRVLAPQSLAGQDHGPGVDLAGTKARARIGVVDDPPEPGIVDTLLVLVGRERDRRLVEGFTRDHVVAAGEVLAVTAQVDARENDLRAGGADIDADGHQRHMVLQPDRILLQRAIVVEFEMVVIVVGIFVVYVDDVLAIEMVGQVMSARLRLVVICHQNLPLSAQSYSHITGSRPPGGRLAPWHWPAAPVVPNSHS